MVHLNMITITGMAGLLLGLMGLYFSPYRHWVMAMIAGMCYWAALEGVSAVSTVYFNLSHMEGYLVGITLTLIMLAIWLALTEASREEKQRALRLSRQIEHTPLHAEHWRGMSKF